VHFGSGVSPRFKVGADTETCNHLSNFVLESDYSRVVKVIVVVVADEKEIDIRHVSSGVDAGSSECF
jgi:hypothetical protein